MRFTEPREKCHILLIEDNIADIFLIKEALSSADTDVEMTTIEDGAKALALLHRQASGPGPVAFDLVVLDLSIPKVEAWQLVETLRGNDRLKSLPIVIFSASASPHDRVRAERYEVEQFIAKPSDLDRFLQVGNVLKELLLKRECSLGVNTLH